MRKIFSCVLFVLGILISPYTIENFFTIDGQLDIATFTASFIFSFFLIPFSLLLFFIKNDLSILRYKIRIRDVLIWFLVLSITPIFFATLESLMWLGNRFLGNHSDSRDITAQTIMKNHDKTNQIRVAGITLPSPIESDFFNINKFGFRTNKFSPKNQEFRIALVGGSTVYGINVADQNTISSHLKKFINDEYKNKITVWNLGVSGANSKDELEVIQYTHDKIQPDMYVFYHGANDYANFYNLILEREQKSLVLDDNFKNRLFVFLNKFQTVSLLNILVNYIFKSTSISQPSGDLFEKINTSVNLFYKRIDKIRYFCSTQNVVCQFFLQPIIESKKPLTFFEKKILAERRTFFPNYGKYYDLFVESVLEKNFYEYSDLRNVLSNKEQRFFYDYVHTTSPANKIIAFQIFNNLRTKLEENLNLSTY